MSVKKHPGYFNLKALIRKGNPEALTKVASDTLSFMWLTGLIANNQPLHYAAQYGPRANSELNFGKPMV
jgi:hypothetical protein